MACPMAEERIPLGKHIRFFGDGFQKSKLLLGRRYWRIPVMDGEFLVEDSLGVAKGVAGGNLILQGVDLPAALDAARRAVAALADEPGVDHALSWRNGAERQQGGLALQEAPCFDGRRVLPRRYAAASPHNCIPRPITRTS